MRVLVVDDEYVSRIKLKALLSAYGDCDAVGDGDLALRMIVSAYEESVPYDLISMDVNMPEISGREVVRRLRQWEGDHPELTRGIEARVLMVTVANDPKDVMGSFSEGAEWYIVKPVTPQKIAEAMERIDFSSRKKAVAPSVTAAAAPTPAPAGAAGVAEPTSNAAEAVGLELPPIESITADGLEAEFWAEYASSAAIKLDELEQAALELESDVTDPAPLEAIMRLLHSLKGEAGMIGLMSVNQVCHDAESALKDQPVDEKTPDLILAVKDWIDSAVQAVGGQLGDAAAA